MNRVLFIINSLLHSGSGKDIAGIISGNLDKMKFGYQVCYSEHTGHCTELALVDRDKYDIIVAAGGDGTINEIGQVLTGTDKLLGIIPIGSGNGLARTILNGAISPIESIRIINALNFRHIDMGLINGEPFFNMAGVGFDADVAHRYNRREKRGFFSYIRTAAGLYFGYPSRTYEILNESGSFSVNAFLISFANTSQWGYNAHICPGADPSDGMLGITIIRAFPKIIIPFLVWRLFTKTLDRSRFVKTFMTKSIGLKSPGEINGHIDGNAVVFQDNINIEIVHNAVKVITA